MDAKKNGIHFCLNNFHIQIFHNATAKKLSTLY